MRPKRKVMDLSELFVNQMRNARLDFKRVGLPYASSDLRFTDFVAKNNLMVISLPKIFQKRKNEK